MHSPCKLWRTKIGCVFLFFTCLITLPVFGVPLSDNNFLVAPGKAIGDVHLGDTQHHVFLILGTPIIGDTSLGRQICCWNVSASSHAGDVTRFDILFQRNAVGNEYFVKQIRTNSQLFHTQQHISVGTHLDVIRGKFEDIKHLDSDEHADISIYGDTGQGIAFEIDSNLRCSAIIVYLPRQPICDMPYIRFPSK
jgi:hypothetical protein